MNNHGISNISSLSVSSSGNTYTGQTEVMHVCGNIGFSYQNHTYS